MSEFRGWIDYGDANRVRIAIFLGSKYYDGGKEGVMKALVERDIFHDHRVLLGNKLPCSCCWRRSKKKAKSIVRSKRFRATSSS